MPIPKLIAKFETVLASGIDYSATSLVLNSALTKDGNILPAGTYGFVIDEGSSDEEYLLGVADGTTATITGLTRGLSYEDGATAIPALAKGHRMGAQIKITDHPVLTVMYTRSVDYRSAYSAGTAYVAQDIVTYNGSTYICKLASTGNVPTNTTYWDVLAVKGDTGATGATGNTGATGAAGAGYTASSSTSNTLGTGSKTFTVAAGLAYTNGARVRASFVTDGSFYMEGLVTSYSGTSLVVDIDRVVGSGSTNGWRINLTGDVGATGATGAQGIQGIQGIQGEQGIQGPAGADGDLTQATADTLYEPKKGADDNFVTDAEKTKLANLSGANSGDETATTAGALINAATAKTTPVDADYVGLMDSAASNVLKKLSWANIKATLKTYFDTLYGNVAGQASSVDSEMALFSGTGGKTIKRATGTGFCYGTSGVLSYVTAPGGALVGDTATQTLTNKRITPRITSITSHATPTINTDNCDAVTITAQAEAITSMTTNLSGTPTNFQKLIIRIKDNGTARAITWGTGFEAKGVALPTTTVLSKVMTLGFIYDTVTSKWGLVASAQEA